MVSEVFRRYMDGERILKETQDLIEKVRYYEFEGRFFEN